MSFLDKFFGPSYEKELKGAEPLVSAINSKEEVFSILSDEEFAYVNFLKIANGAVIQSHTSEIKKKLPPFAVQVLPPFGWPTTVLYS